MSRLFAFTSALALAVLGAVSFAAPATAALDKHPAVTPQSEINKIVNSLKAGLHATYEAVYTADYAGVSQTVTMAQRPPKSLYKMVGPPITVGTAQEVGSALEVDTGSKTYGCNVDKSPAICFAQNTGAAYEPEEDSFRPSAVIFALDALEASLTGSTAGTTVTSSSQRLGGQSTSCVSIQSAKPAKYCVTKKGVLAFVSAAGNTLQLERVSQSPPSSLFKLPAGAQVEATP